MLLKRPVPLYLIFLSSVPSFALAQGKGIVTDFLDGMAPTYAAIASDIWEFAEVGYQEERSSRLLQTTLREAGFSVESGVAGIPTAFVATYGAGSPIIAVLAEFDALPGISQAAKPVRQILVEGGAGHACGHHLFGTASTAAAIAVKEWLRATGRTGTIRVYGTPAEEGGAGKVYMARAGLFEDVDVVLHWHPGDRNDASPSTTLANQSAKFRFHGYSAHAAGAPEQARSALDGVEAMNHMVNMLREHVPQTTRIHYVITRGGNAPNVVPDFAEVYYYVRHPHADTVVALFDRVVKAADGAALGTGTRMEFEIIHGLYPVLPNATLAKVVDANLRELGGITYSADEQAFAEAIRETLVASSLPLGSQGEIRSFIQGTLGMGSTDVGDISWLVPTAGLRTATWVPGTAAHSWQAVAAGGTSIGAKGMMLAAKALARTAIDLIEQPSLIEQANREFLERRGSNFVYRSLVGDRAPPLDYRR